MYFVGILYCCAAAVFWALGPVFLKKGLTFLDYTDMAAARTIGFVGASLFICIFDSEASVLWKFPAHLLFFVFLNIFIGNIVGDLSYFRSIELIGVSRAVAAACCYPLFVTIISFFWLGESITLPLFLGTIVMIAGLFLLKAGDGGKNGDEEKTAPWSGFLFALVTAICWAIAMVLQKWLLSVQNIPAASVTLWRAFFLFAASWSFWAWRSRTQPGRRSHLLSAPRKAWGSAIAAGACGLAAGGYAFALAIQIIPVSVATPITAASPLLAAVMGVLLFHESMRPVQWMGILCIISGLLAVNT